MPRRLLEGEESVDSGPSIQAPVSLSASLAALLVLIGAGWILGRRVLREPLPIIDAHAVLRDDTDLLRELEAPYRARVHDDRCRHPRPALPATRRGHVFPDGGGRACVEGRRVAEEQGLAPKEYADRIVGAWQEVPRRIEATNDFFIRTTDEGHKTFVADFLQRIYDAGDIYEDVYAGLYCGLRSVQDGVGDRRREVPAPRHRAGVDRGEELVLPAFGLPEATGLSLRGASGLRAARVSLQRGAKFHRIGSAGLLDQPRGTAVGRRDPVGSGAGAYVWADALVNYLSALTYARPGEDLRTDTGRSVRHLIGKDIIRFHCVFWPAMLLSAGYEVPHQIFVHGYLLLDDRKISKSLGNVVDPLDLVDVYGADPVRFWAMRAVAFGQDGTVSLESLHERYEREPRQRSGQSRLAYHRHGRPFPRRGASGVVRADSPVAALVEGLADDVARRFDAFDLTGALERIWVVVRG